MRFAHTGEVLGLTGQTVAGLVSAGAVVMVWTGLALSWRRFRAWVTRGSAPGPPCPSPPPHPRRLLPSSPRSPAREEDVPVASAPLQARRHARPRPPDGAAGAVLAGTFAGRPRAGAAAAGGAGGAPRRPRRATFFDLPEGTVATVLAGFTRVTGLQRVARQPDLGSVMSPGVKGTMTASQAMTALLMGTSLQGRFEATRQVSLASAECVSRRVSAARAVFLSPLHGAAARRRADGRAGAARGPRAAVRDHAHRRAAQRARHHAAGRRRRWRVQHRRRHVQHARLQRQQQPLRGQRPRQRPHRPRRVQRRAGRSVHGADRLRRGPRHRRRLREPADQAAAHGHRRKRDADRRQRRSGSRDRRPQHRRRPARTRAGWRVGVPRQRPVAGPRRAGTRLRENESHAVAPSLAWVSTRARACSSAAR